LVTPEHGPNDDKVSMQEADDVDHDAYSKYISARVHLPDPQGIVKTSRQQWSRKGSEMTRTLILLDISS
jgi:hypothetical protein